MVWSWPFWVSWNLLASLSVVKEFVIVPIDVFPNVKVSAAAVTCIDAAPKIDMVLMIISRLMLRAEVFLSFLKIPKFAVLVKLFILYSLFLNFKQTSVPPNLILFEKSCMFFVNFIYDFANPV